MLFRTVTNIAQLQVSRLKCAGLEVGTCIGTGQVTCWFSSPVEKNRHYGRHKVTYVKARYSHNNSLGQAVPGTANLGNEVIGRCHG